MASGGRRSVEAALLLLFLRCVQSLEEEDLARLINDLQRHLRSSYVVITHSEERLHAQKSLVTVSQLLFSAGAMATVLAQEQPLLPAGKGPGSGHPLAVLLLREVDIPVMNAFLQEVSKEQGFSLRKWLIMITLSKEKREESREVDALWQEMLEGVFLPPDCLLLLSRSDTNATDFSSAYRTGPHKPLLLSRWGRWTRDVGLHPGATDPLKGRRNLRGQPVKVTSKDYPPHVMLAKKAGKSVISGGYFFDIWRLLQTAHNFTTDFREPADNAWGTRAADGTWSGMVGEVQRGERDAAVAPLVMDGRRATAVAYSQTLIVFKVHVLVRAPDGEGSQLGNELTIFNVSLWLATAGAVVATGALLAVTLRCSPSRALLPSPTTSFFSALSVFLSQDPEPQVPSKGSAGTTAVVASLTTLLLLNVYSSQLVALSSVQRARLPFRTFEDLLEEKSFVLTSPSRGAFLDDLINSPSAVVRSVYTTLMQATMSTSAPSTSMEGLKRACHPGSGYYINLDVYAYLRRGLHCKLAIVPEARTYYSVGYIFPKRSPYRRLFMRSVTRIRESGLMQYAVSHVWPDLREVEASRAEDTVAFAGVRLPGVLATLSLFLAAAAGALLTLAAEAAWRRTQGTALGAPRRGGTGNPEQRNVYQRETSEMIEEM